MKKIITATIITIALASCTAKWEYTVVHFDRDEASAMEMTLSTLGAEGWEYAGPLTNNGMNAKFIAFKRKK